MRLTQHAGFNHLLQAQAKASQRKVLDAARTLMLATGRGVQQLLKRQATSTSTSQSQLQLQRHSTFPVAVRVGHADPDQDDMDATDIDPVFLAESEAEFDAECNILFSDRVNKHNRHNRTSPRILALTLRACYILTGSGATATGSNTKSGTNLGSSYTIIRRIELRNIEGINMSRLCNDLCVIRCKGEHDFLFTTPKRAEFVYHLQTALQSISSASARCALLAPTLDPSFEFSERLYVRDRDGRTREVLVLDSQRFKLGKPSFLAAHA